MAKNPADRITASNGKGSDRKAGRPPRIQSAAAPSPFPPIADYLADPAELAWGAP